MISGTAILFILLAIFFSTISKILFRHVLKETDTYAFTFVNQIISMLLFLPLLIFNFSMPSNPQGWIALIIAGGIWASTVFIGNLSYKYSEVSIRESLSQTRIIWVLLFGVLFLNESITLSGIIGIFTIFFGLGLLLWHPERKLGRIYDKKVLIVLLGAFMISIATIADKYVLRFFSPEVYSFFSCLIPFLALSFFLKGKTPHIKHLFKHRGVTAILAIAFSAVSYYFVLLIFSSTNITIAYPILQAGILFTVIGGIIFMKERENITQKIIASIIVIVGTIIIGK
jgi:drug/metabolite transporter (DMT)-like permease